MAGRTQKRVFEDKVLAGVYVRVSTTDQSTDAQEAELTRYAERRGWSVYRVYRDKGQSGAKVNRPALDELMADCRRGKIDVVLVWKFDRFARSLKQLVDGMEEFKDRGIDFVSFTEQIDTTTAAGEFFFQVFGAVAQFERSLISERVKAGLLHARKSGKCLGRPPVRKLDADETEKLKAECSQKKSSIRFLAKKYGTSTWQVFKLREAQQASAYPKT